MPRKAGENGKKKRNSYVPDDLPESCVYLVWAADRKSVYVGSSSTMSTRYEGHRTAILLGCHFEVYEALPGLTRSELRKREDAAIIHLRETGVNVVVPTNKEMFTAWQQLAHEARMKKSPKDRRWNCQTTS